MADEGALPGVLLSEHEHDLELFELLLSAVILHRRISQATSKAKSAPQENAGHVALVGSPGDTPTGRSPTETVIRRPPASAVTLNDAREGLATVSVSYFVNALRAASLASSRVIMRQALMT